MKLSYQNSSPYDVYTTAFRMLNYLGKLELEEPLPQWMAELAEANEALIERLSDKPKQIGLKDQSKALLKCVVSIRTLVNSCLLSDDAVLVEHAKAIDRVLKTYMGFGRMSAESKMSNSELLCRDLSTPEMLPHVEAIPELSERLSLLERARKDVLNRRLEMIYADVKAKDMPQLQPLKRNVAQLMNKIGDYLKAMSCVDAEAYGPMLRMFQIILRDQATRRRIAIKRKKHKTQENQDASTVKLTKSVAEKKDKGLDAEIGEG